MENKSIKQALLGNIARNTTKINPHDKTTTKKVEKIENKERKKLPAEDVKDKVISFKVSSNELIIIQSKITLEHNKPSLIARHYLKEHTDLFKPN